jgi:NAD(P)-dependent dehydrogenase (short-subunit alcohol dehydrogenase family)
VSDVANIDGFSDTYENIDTKFDGKIDVLVVNAGVHITAPLIAYTEVVCFIKLLVYLGFYFNAILIGLQPFLNILRFKLKTQLLL